MIIRWSGRILEEKRRPEMYIVYIRRNVGWVEQIRRPNRPRITYTLELWRTLSSPTPRNALEYLSEVDCAVYIPFSAWPQLKNFPICYELCVPFRR